MTTVIKTIQELKVQVKNWKSQNFSIGLVPTMGALHRGHESLIQKARPQCDKVIVSIFVNPIQFGPNEDFEKYPRQLEKDLTVCENNGVDIIFAPEYAEMYSNLEEITKVVPQTSLQDKLCGKSRPGHFNGVATVVLKLFNITQPDKAFFGQKDAQQLLIIKKMVSDLNVPVEIIPCPIIREDDGLALSSRNAYLSPSDREKALSVSKTLNFIKNLYENGETNTKNILQKAINNIDKTVLLEYLDIRNMETLQKVAELKSGCIVAIAAKVGNVRLIDNIIF